MPRGDGNDSAVAGAEALVVTHFRGDVVLLSREDVFDSARVVINASAYSNSDLFICLYYCY